MPETLLIYDATDAIAAEVIDLLADWHASGWVAGFSSISTAEIAAKGPDVASALVREAASSEKPLITRRLLDLRNSETVRLIALDVIGRDPSWLRRREELHIAARRLNEALPHRAAAVDLLVPYFGASMPTDIPTWPGWDTVLCAPEQSNSVEQIGLPLYVNASDPQQVDELAAHAAAFVAGISGLWNGMARGYFDHTDRIDDLRAGRTAHRRIDASALADQLRDLCFKEEMLRAADAVSALNTAVLTERADALQPLIKTVPPPEPIRPQGPDPIGFWASIKKFLSFMLSALLQAPAEAARSVTYRVKSGTATALQSVIYGSDSGKIITVGGVTAATQGEDIQATEESLAALDAKLRKVQGLTIPQTAMGASQGAFWQACFEHAFALVSGTRQGNAEACLQEGQPRYFTVEQVAPQVGYWRPEGELVTGIPVSGIALGDVRAVRSARAVLEASQREEFGWQGRADDHLGSLRDAATPWLDSFMGRVGLMISAKLGGYEQQVAELLAALQVVAQEDTGEAEGLIKGLRRFSVIASGLVLAGIGVAWLLHASVVPGLPVVLITVLGLVGLLVAIFGKTLRAKQKLFHLQNRRQEDTEQRLNRVVAELPIAVENARRLARLYAQYCVWGPILSAFLARPFGLAQGQAAHFPGMAGSLPKSVSCGLYTDPAAEEAGRCAVVIAELMRTSAVRLWLDFALLSHGALVADAPHFHRVSAEDLFGQSDTQPDAFLMRWKASTLDASAEKPQLARSICAAMDRSQMHRLLSTVPEQDLAQLRRAYRIQQVGAGGKPPGDRFTSAVPARFDTAFLSLEGINDGVAEADVFEVFPSATVQDLPTRNWLDEVDTAIILTRRTRTSAFALRQAVEDINGDGPIAPELKGM